MAHIFMNSFDWAGFNEVLARPSSEIASRLAKKIKKGDIPSSIEDYGMPRGEPEIAAFLDSFLKAVDWYGGKTPREAHLIDGVVYALFADKILAKPLKIRPMGMGINTEIVDIARGVMEINEDRAGPGDTYLYLKKTDLAAPPDVSEILHLGFRPFRSPAWDRQSNEEVMGLRFTSTDGIEAVHIAEYSIHSPDQVATLAAEMGPIQDRVCRELDRVKSIPLREGLTAHFEADLADPIRKAADAGRAVFARQDH